MAGCDTQVATFVVGIAKKADYWIKQDSDQFENMKKHCTQTEKEVNHMGVDYA